MRISPSHALVPLVVALLSSTSSLVAQEDPNVAPRIPMAEFKQLQIANNVLVVDVRDAQSFAAGHIPGARSIPLTSLSDPARIAELKTVTKEIVLYCA